MSLGSKFTKLPRVYVNLWV